MPRSDRLLALGVAVVWGLNFLAIHVTLEHFPPFLAASLRFAVVAVPTLLLVRPPGVPLRWLLGYGAGFGVLQFAFLYLAMDAGMPTGLASLVLQSSAPFTVLLGAWLLRERITARQAAGVGAAVLGLAGIAAHRGLLDGAAAAVPVLLTLAGGLGWALGNLASRQARAESPFRLMLWMTVVPPLPLAALSAVVEGPERAAAALGSLGSPTGLWALAGLAYTAVVATVGGTGAWTALMSRHPSSTVAPFSLLVPVVGMIAAAVALGERVPGVELALGVLVVGGVLVGSRPPGAGRAAAVTEPGVAASRAPAAVVSAAAPATAPVRPAVARQAS